jgi:hypothetical protein
VPAILRRHNPGTVVNKINAQMRRVVAAPEFTKQLESIGLEPSSSTPREMGDLIRTVLARWTNVIKEAHSQPPTGCGPSFQCVPAQSQPQKLTCDSLPKATRQPQGVTSEG